MDLVESVQFWQERMAPIIFDNNEEPMLDILKAGIFIEENLWKTSTDVILTNSRYTSHGLEIDLEYMGNKHGSLSFTQGIVNYKSYIDAVVPKRNYIYRLSPQMKNQLQSGYYLQFDWLTIGETSVPLRLPCFDLKDLIQCYFKLLGGTMAKKYMARADKEIIGDDWHHGEYSKMALPHGRFTAIVAPTSDTITVECILQNCGKNYHRLLTFVDKGRPMYPAAP